MCYTKSRRLEFTEIQMYTRLIKVLKMLNGFWSELLVERKTRFGHFATQIHQLELIIMKTVMSEMVLGK